VQSLPPHSPRQPPGSKGDSSAVQPTPRTAGNERVLLWTGPERPVPANFCCQATKLRPATALVPTQSHAFNQVMCTAETAPECAPYASSRAPIAALLHCLLLVRACRGDLRSAKRSCCRHAGHRPRCLAGGLTWARGVESGRHCPASLRAMACACTIDTQACARSPAAPPPNSDARASGPCRAAGTRAPPRPRSPARATRRARARVTRRTGRVCARCRRAPCSGCPRSADCCRL
jgi:hypothetical protein